MRISFESVLMLLTENCQNWSMLFEATACQSWRVFETRCSFSTPNITRQYSDGDPVTEGTRNPASAGIANRPLVFLGIFF